MAPLCTPPSLDPAPARARENAKFVPKPSFCNANIHIEQACGETNLC